MCTLGLAGLLAACGGGGSGGDAGGSGSEPTTHAVGGTLSGLATGQNLQLSNGSDSLTLSANGSFAFATALATGAGYQVQVAGAQPAWQHCTVSNAAGTVGTSAVANVAVACTSTDTAPTGALNDTGIDWCSENISTPSTWVNNAVCSAVNWVGNLWGQQQDAFSGRDAQARAGTLAKVGSGMAGFDFSKLSSTGQVLANQNAAWSDSGSEAAGTRWDCVRDNVTGLVWEVKRNDTAHLRHMNHTYTWYNPDNTTNGGSAGTQASSTCTGVADVNQCNTHSYVAAVNAAGLCGKSDWRLPTVDELRNLAHIGRIDPAIDTDHFPNTPSDWYWSSSPYAGSSGSAWLVDFDNGGGYFDHKDYAARVRLVRSGQ